MGQEVIDILTESQRKILDQFKNSKFLSKTFYFSGGTALSAYYLEHRYSDDLDFFSEKRFDSFELLSSIQKLGEIICANLDSRSVEDTYIYSLKFENGYSVKVDFAYYPYKPIEKFLLDGTLKVDSLKDIAINKFVMISQRNDIKDFIDLFFLLKEFSVYDLYNWAKVKFKRDCDLLLFASDLMKVLNFDYLPRMIEKISIDEIKNYYIGLAGSIGLDLTE